MLWWLLSGDFGFKFQGDFDELSRAFRSNQHGDSHIAVQDIGGSHRGAKAAQHAERFVSLATYEATFSEMVGEES